MTIDPLSKEEDIEGLTTKPYKTQQRTISELSALSFDTEGVDSLDDMLAGHLLDKWQELVESWDELSNSFNELGGFLGQGWDLTQGVLASQGWQDITRYRKMIEKLPDIQRLMKLLGRLQTVTDQEFGKSITGSIVDPISRKTPKEEEVVLPHVIMETGGLERSNDLSRMLPAEYAQLGHPVMKSLWFARYAERMLLSYQYQGLSTALKPCHEVLDNNEGGQDENEASGMGPIIICLDTSASMQGEPEQIAKAVTLEALSIAFKEERACHLYMFGGPEEIIEHQLDLTRDGLADLIQFLTCSFHGGTDAVTPLLTALEKQRNNNWQKADILLISDGRFPLKEYYVTQINELKERQQLRLHGLILGGWKSQSMAAICEPLHFFDAWALSLDK